MFFDFEICPNLALTNLLRNYTRQPFHVFRADESYMKLFHSDFFDSILDHDIDEDNDLSLQIISHSSYYDSKKLSKAI